MDLENLEEGLLNAGKERAMEFAGNYLNEEQVKGRAVGDGSDSDDDPDGQADEDSGDDADDQGDEDSDDDSDDVDNSDGPDDNDDDDDDHDDK